MSPEIIAMFGMSVTILLAIWGIHRSLRTEMRMEIGGLRTEMRTEIGGLRAEIGGLRTEIGGLRTEMYTGFSDLRREMQTERNAHIEQWHLHREQQA